MSYRDEDTLRRLYRDKRLSGPEIADRYNVSPRTIYNWMDKFGIDRWSDGDARPGVGLSIDDKGYYRWRTEYDGERFYVRVHRLLAVAEYGFDAVAGKHVHHGEDPDAPCPVAWANWPANIIPKSAGEHMSDHTKERWEAGDIDISDPHENVDRDDEGNFVSPA